MKEIDLALDYNVDQVIKVNGVSLIDELTPYNFPIYKYTNLPILIMFINPNDIKSDFHLNILSKVA